MQQNTIEIEVPEGYEIDCFDKQTSKIKFKKKPKVITERIKSVDDVLAHHGITKDQFESSHSNDSVDEKAYALLKLLALSLNEGWTPNWDNSNEVKYIPYFYMGGSSGFRYLGYDRWDSHSGVGSRLCFKTRELAIHAGTHFTDIYKQLMII